MRTENKTIEIYKFEELSEDIKEKLITEWRINDFFSWSEENNDSLKAFADLFDITIKDWNIGHWYINFSYDNEEIENLDFMHLRKWLINNYYDDITGKKYYSTNGSYIDGNYNYKSRYSNIFITRLNCPFTGYCMDNDLISPIFEFLDHPYDTDIKSLLDLCLQSWLESYKKDLEFWYSEEGIKEEILGNDYEFTIDGKIY